MKIKKPILSVIIIAKNEEKKIKDCLKSVGYIKTVHEIIFINTGSTDKTISIAKEFTEKIFITSQGSYSEWRNYGHKKAIGDWVLYLDADERITVDLAREIDLLVSHTIHHSPSTIVAYAIPRLNIILNKEMKHGGWWPDYVKRLFIKDSLIKWVGDLHEEPVYKGIIKHLTNYLVHIKHDNLEDMVEKTNKWSDVEAKLMFNADHPKMNTIRFLSAMWREFYLRMIKHKAFLDGDEGIIYAIYQVWSKFISYAKLWELQSQNNNIRMNANSTNHYKQSD